jgi:hypothetical protein
MEISLTEKEVFTDLRITAINSIAAGLIAFVLLWTIQLFISMLAATTFEFRGIIYFDALKFLNATGKYELDRVLFFYGLGPILSLLLTLVFSRLFANTQLRQYRLLLAWGAFFSIFFFFGLIGSSFFSRRFLGVLVFFSPSPKWFGYVASAPLFAAAILVARPLVPFFLRTSTANDMVEEYKKEFFQYTVLFPSLVISLVLGLISLLRWQQFTLVLIIAFLAVALAVNLYGNSRYDFRSVKNERAKLNTGYLIGAGVAVAWAVYLNVVGLHIFVN